MISQPIGHGVDGSDKTGRTAGCAYLVAAGDGMRPKRTGFAATGGYTAALLHSAHPSICGAAGQTPKLRTRHAVAVARPHCRDKAVATNADEILLLSFVAVTYMQQFIASGCWRGMPAIDPRRGLTHKRRTVVRQPGACYGLGVTLNADRSDRASSPCSRPWRSPRRTSCRRP